MDWSIAACMLGFFNRRQCVTELLWTQMGGFVIVKQAVHHWVVWLYWLSPMQVSPRLSCAEKIGKERQCKINNGKNVLTRYPKANTDHCDSAR